MKITFKILQMFVLVLMQSCGKASWDGKVHNTET